MGQVPLAVDFPDVASSGGPVPRWARDLRNLHPNLDTHQGQYKEGSGDLNQILDLDLPKRFA